jgi:arginase
VTALHIFSLPYHAAQRDVAMGLGPTELLERHHLAARLERLGLDVAVTVIEAPDRRPEIKRTIELDARLADAVRGAVAAGAFPLVLSGNCNSALGTTAGISRGDLGVLWFDAHADFDTPEDNLSGFFDVFALAILTGSCWRALRRTIPGFREIDETRVVLAAVRDLEPYQRARLERSALNLVPGAQIRSGGIERALRPALDRLSATAGAVYLHIDLDSLDRSEGSANEYAAPGGVTFAELDWAIGTLFDSFEVGGAALTAYDPSIDRDGRAGKTAARVVEAVARRVAARSAQPFQA